MLRNKLENSRDIYICR